MRERQTRRDSIFAATNQLRTARCRAKRANIPQLLSTGCAEQCGFRSSISRRRIWTPPMNDRTVAALTEAIQDEYKARATYRKVIAVFGSVRPFVNIIEAEGRHVEALLRQFDRLGEPPPADEWAERAEAPASIAAACEMAISAEIDNAAMYDRLLTMVDDPTVRKVLLNLQDASKNRHLPAFRRCLERSRS